MCWLGYANQPSPISCRARQAGEDTRTGGQRFVGGQPSISTLYAAETQPTTHWERIDLPHDFIHRNGTLTPSEDPTRGYFTRGVGWYRKRFRLPSSWNGASTVLLRFEAAFNEAEVHLNGQLACLHRRRPYLGFTCRLDNITSLRYGSDVQPNVVSVRVDASWGSGHWYEGGGLWRNVQLIRLHDITCGGWTVCGAAADNEW